MLHLLKQLFSLFQKGKTKQKLLLLSMGALCIVIVATPFIMIRYQPLFPNRSLSSNESKDVKEFLEKNGVRYRQKEEDQFFVATKDAAKLQSDIYEKKLLQQEGQAGFELFDTNTWIKGEKELQMLEMRALKGELEKDIAGFEIVKKARVTLDVAPQKLLGSSKYKTKASVILHLQEDAELSHSQLLAITYHIAGAVHGLEPNRIAISDSTGKLYKAIHSEGEEEVVMLLSKEEQYTEKITKLMNRVVGRGHFHLTLSILEEKILAVALLIEQAFYDQEMTTTIENQLRTLFVEELKIVIDPMRSGDSFAPKHSTRSFSVGWFYGGALLVLSLLFLSFFRRKNKVNGSGIDVAKLAEQLKEQEPKSIALICAYLEPEKAEELLLALPYRVQKKVVLHLADYKREGA
jgi:hypothetical protein